MVVVLVVPGRYRFGLVHQHSSECHGMARHLPGRHVRDGLVHDVHDNSMMPGNKENHAFIFCNVYCIHEIIQNFKLNF